jgi:hypothetical protein
LRLHYNFNIDRPAAKGMHHIHMSTFHNSKYMA